MADVQRQWLYDILVETLQRILWCKAQHNRWPDTSDSAEDILRVLDDGLPRTREMIDAALQTQTAGIYLPGLVARDLIDVRREGRKYWYRLGAWRNGRA